MTSDLSALLWACGAFLKCPVTVEFGLRTMEH